MERTGRAEVLCGTYLEGPGPPSEPALQLCIVAVVDAGHYAVNATLFHSMPYGRDPIWIYSFYPQGERDAIDRVNAITKHPRDFFEAGQYSGIAIKREAIKALLSGLKIKFQVDNTQGEADLAGESVTVGMGRYLAGQIERGAKLTPVIVTGIRRFFAKAPFDYGFWSPYKRLIKLLETQPAAEGLLAVALARIDGPLHQGGLVEDLKYFKPLVASASLAVAGPKTISYLQRRGRRWLRRLEIRDSDAYVRCAASFIENSDNQSAQATMDGRWILSDILYGRCGEGCNSGDGLNELPTELDRYDRRWDRNPKAWNQRLDLVVDIWRTTAHNVDILVWAFHVLRSQKQSLPELNASGLRLALKSSSAQLRAHACKQIAAQPGLLLDLDSVAVQSFFEHSSLGQFKAIGPLHEIHAEVESIQKAALDYLETRGLSDIRLGKMPSKIESRATHLLCYALRFMRSSMNADVIPQLTLYVGTSTHFRPLAHWEETLRLLPLKGLLNLREKLPELPKAVMRFIDSACKEALVKEQVAQQEVVEKQVVENEVAQDSKTENLPTDLIHTPCQEPSTFSWALPDNAARWMVVRAWNRLMKQSDSVAGLKSILEVLQFEGRITQIEYLQEGVQWLSRLAVLTASVDPVLSQNLLQRLADQREPNLTLVTLNRMIEQTANHGWASHPAVLEMVLARDPTLTQRLWMAVGRGRLGSVAQVHVASRTLAEAVVRTLTTEDVRTIKSAQARYLAQALRASPSRLYQDQDFAWVCAISPHHPLQQQVISRLEARQQIGSVYVPLAESGRPAALAAAERYIDSIKDRTEFTTAVIMLCDSGSRSARTLGLGFIKDQRERLDIPALWVALAEHTSPDVTAVVARFAASGLAVNGDVLDQFDNRVLRTRRTGRMAKELVKSRLEQHMPDTAGAAGALVQVDDHRIQVLVDMARGLALRDRDWALTQLARLALEGRTIPHVQVSTTT